MTFLFSLDITICVRFLCIYVIYGYLLYLIQTDFYYAVVYPFIRQYRFIFSNTSINSEVSKK